VERSGQGADLLFETAIREGKIPLDYRGTDDFQVMLTLHGRVEDEGFLRFLEHAARDTNTSFSTQELVVLGAVRRQQPVPDAARPSVQRLLDLGMIERAARRSLILARRYHTLVGKPGDYTRQRGLDHETNKVLLLRHRSEECGPLFVPSHKLVPDARWILGASADEVLPRADPDTPAPRRGVTLIVNSRIAIFKQAWSSPSDPATIQSPPAGWPRVVASDYYAAYARC
jgi:hypothetical protein